MKLTHDKVRAILARLERDGQPDGCDHDCDERCDECDPLHDTQALCEEWLARRTVRWADDSDERSGRLYCDEPGRWYGFFVRRVERFDARVNEQRDVHAEGATFGSADEARAWLEERAREAGFEVAT